MQFNDVIRTVTFGKGGAGEPEACVPRCQCGHRFTMLSFSVCCEAGGKVWEIAATAGKGRAACYGWQSFHLLPARDFLSAGSSPALWKEVQYYKRMYCNVLTDSTVVSLGTVGDRKLDQRLVCSFVLCTWFKSLLDYLWIFHRFPQPLKGKAELGHRIHHNGFRTNPYQLIFHQLSCHRCYKTGVTIILLK